MQWALNCDKQFGQEWPDADTSVNSQILKQKSYKGFINSYINIIHIQQVRNCNKFEY